MRIIAGSRKGLKIGLPGSCEARPFTDRIKESVFGILGDRIGGARVLDLFAGPGSCGLEALSRGAFSAVFVDSSPECACAIRENLKRIDMEGDVLCRPAQEALREFSAENMKFKVVFLDPPFKDAKDSIDGLMGELIRSGILSPGAVVVVRCHFKTVLEAPPEGLVCFRAERYGENRVFFYLYGEKDES